MARVVVWALTIALALLGIAMAVGGILLLANGGSAYYVIAGLAIVFTSQSLARRRSSAVIVYGAMLAATLAWSLWEVGLDGWALAPRLLFLAGIGLLLLLPPIRVATLQPSRWWLGAPIIAITVTMVIASVPSRTAPHVATQIATPAADARSNEWQHYGRTLSGARYSPLTQIDTNNVGKLERAWTYVSDVPRFGTRAFQMTPLAVNERLYTCVDRNILVALDPDDGHELWRFDPHTDLNNLYATNCRGVSYYEAPQPIVQCQKRIILGVGDGRLMAVDAESGHVCSDFGTNGSVDLKLGMGPLAPSQALPTSPATIVNGVAVQGQFVLDFLGSNTPSGVVRGYDAVTGELRWAWDAGRPDLTGPPAEGETYTRNTPNAWSIFSADEGLDLVYIPTGNSPPDYFGGNRSPQTEEFSSSIVAIEVATGKVRWHFRTVNHDIWDYDVPSQPVLVDLPNANGELIPALIAPTKRGQLFVLDRRDGTPIDPVVQKPVPQGATPGDWTAKTQPYTTGFPSVAGEDLTEASMWGITPLDQLWCRIRFKEARYEGQFTPPGTRLSIAYPGAAGASNWGSVAVDTDRGLLVANTLHVADIGVQMPIKAGQLEQQAQSHYAFTLFMPQDATPYVFKRSAFMSPLDVPCQQPPYGRISVFDLKTRKLVWSEPLGTARHSGPLGLQTFLPIRIGVPNMGGSIATAGGLIFVGATQDRYLRAFDITNGEELWRADLPAVGAATPMTYASKRTGRQYVVIAAGGHPGVPGPVDSSFVAFALPTK